MTPNQLAQHTYQAITPILPRLGAIYFSYALFLKYMPFSGEIMGSILRFSLELNCMADAVELFRQDREFNCTEVSKEAAGIRNGCFEKEVRRIKG